MQFCIASLLGGNLPSMFSFFVGEDPSHEQYDRRGKNAYALSVEVSLTVMSLLGFDLTPLIQRQAPGSTGDRCHMM